MTKQFIKKISYVSSLANERAKSEGYALKPMRI